MLGERCVEFLESLGCCRRCILIYLGDRSTQVIYSQSIPTINQRIKQLSRQISESDQEENGFQDDSSITTKYESTQGVNTSESSEISNQADTTCTVLENGSPEHVVKKQKCEVCISCIGLLQKGASSDVVKMLSDAIVARGCDSDLFTLALCLPVSLSLRIHWTWTLLLQSEPKFPSKGREDHVGTVKDIWKNLVGPQIEANVKKSFVLGPSLDLIVNVSATYINDLEDCKIMDQLCEAKFSIRRKQHRKYSAGVYSKQAIDTAIKNLSDEAFLKVCSQPPVIPEEAVTFSDINCQQAPLYMAGRYNKYSRELPQTPWLVDGERKMGSSVQELLVKILNDTVKAEDLRFSSSGREDVDVRCLGTGRPFVVEFLNPCRTKISRKEVTQLQLAVNNSSNLIYLRDLQIVDRKDIKNLKEGEEEKTKAYCALCIARDGYDPIKLKSLSDMGEITVQQKTPLRVLHRRNLATRHRLIYKMEASPVNNLFFKLCLTTQAGTYIKEFIHGDLGRTTPSLGSILGLDLDIVALDVEKVALDWPPSCGE